MPPEPKARTAGQLIAHLVGHEQDVLELVETGIIHHRMEAPFDDLVLGESVAIDGACLTVVEIIADAFRVDAVANPQSNRR